MCHSPRRHPNSRLALKAERRAWSRGRAKPRQPSSSPSGPPRNRTLYELRPRGRRRGCRRDHRCRARRSARTETAIATAIIARGSTRAAITHRAEARETEKPSNRRRNAPPPRTVERMTAVMLGPNSAMTFRASRRALRCSATWTPCPTRSPTRSRRSVPRRRGSGFGLPRSAQGDRPRFRSPSGQLVRRRSGRQCSRRRSHRGRPRSDRRSHRGRGRPAAPVGLGNPSRCPLQGSAIVRPSKADG